VIAGPIVFLLLVFLYASPCTHVPFFLLSPVPFLNVPGRSELRGVPWMVSPPFPHFPLCPMYEADPVSRRPNSVVVLFIYLVPPFPPSDREEDGSVQGSPSMLRVIFLPPPLKGLFALARVHGLPFVHFSVTFPFPMEPRTGADF